VNTVRVGKHGQFGEPFIDVDEWRDQPVRHRYVHGGFAGTKTLFSFYFPEAAKYQRRFLHLLEGGAGGNENTALLPFGFHSVEFAFENGSYLVESNHGHSSGDYHGYDRETLAFRASSESARYARQLAERMYGSAPRFGYVYGISGGGGRSIICMERAPDVWQGAVPGAICYPGQFYGLTLHAATLLGDELPAVIDACDVGGSGNPWPTLRVEQREALAALYRAGWGRGAEFLLAMPFEARTIFASHVGMLKAFDPDYWSDFWTKTGYVGHDQPGTLQRYLVQTRATVRGVITAADLRAEVMAGTRRGLSAILAMTRPPETVIALRLDVHDPLNAQRLQGCQLDFTSGSLAGSRLYVADVDGDLVFGGAAGALADSLFTGAAVGDELALDNRDLLAYGYYYRTQANLEVDRLGEHHVEWQQLVVDGQPIYQPRRLEDWDHVDVVLPYTHEFKGKMIVLQHCLDAANWPSHAANYADGCTRRMGAAAVREQLSINFLDHAAHIPGHLYPSGDPPVPTSRLIDYEACLHQAIRDVIAWVELGTKPTQSNYRRTPSNAIELPPDASRGGLQPVVSLLADGAVRAEVRSGEAVELALMAEAPAGVGTITRVEIDPEGRGAWTPLDVQLGPKTQRVTFGTTHTYTSPGTWFPSVRVTTHRFGDSQARFCQIANLGRARVIVR
jgi:hypothetical protein